MGIANYSCYNGFVCTQESLLICLKLCLSMDSSEYSAMSFNAANTIYNNFNLDLWSNAFANGVA